MFTLSQDNNFSYPVTVETVTDGGRIKRNSFNAQFKRLSTDEVTSWQSRISEESRQSPEAFGQCARELAHHVVEGWNDVRDPNGEQIPFSSGALTQLLDIHPVPFSIAQAWLEAVNGGAKRKN